MSTRAITDYVAGLLNGQTYGGFPAVQAVSEFPLVSDAADAPQAFVWPSEGEERRDSAPRGPGLKRALHRVSIYLMYIFDPDTGLSFRDLVEGVMQTIRTTTMPVQGLTDSVTGRQSDILLIGETMRYTISPPEALSDQRLMAFDGEITADITETFRA